jgi:hypothetical protein
MLLDLYMNLAKEIGLDMGSWQFKRASLIFLLELPKKNVLPNPSENEHEQGVVNCCLMKTYSFQRINLSGWIFHMVKKYLNIPFVFIDWDFPKVWQLINHPWIFIFHILP